MVSMLHMTGKLGLFRRSVYKSGLGGRDYEVFDP